MKLLQISQQIREVLETVDKRVLAWGEVIIHKDEGEIIKEALKMFLADTEGKELQGREHEVEELINYAVKEGFLDIDQAEKMTKEEKIKYYEKSMATDMEDAKDMQEEMAKDQDIKVRFNN